MLFQASWGPSNARPGDPLFSVFSVVRNPSDKWPEISCWVIAAGMLLAFGQKLFGYVRSQKKKRLDVATGPVATRSDADVADHADVREEVVA